MGKDLRRLDNQEDGLEAAIPLKSVITHWSTALGRQYNKGSKHRTEAVECIALRGDVLVEERSLSSEARSKELVEWKVTLPA